MISGDLWGGAEAQVYAVIREMAEYPDINLSVITFNKGILFSRINSSCKVSVFVVDEGDNSILGLFRHIYKIIKENRINITHAHGYKENFIGGLVSRILRKKVVRTYHGRGVVGRSRRYKILESINARCLSDQAISVSFELRSFLTNHIKFPRTIAVIQNCINVDDLVPKKSPESLRRQFGFDAGTFIVGSVGRMSPEKGHRYLIDAVNRIRNWSENAYFLIVGNGPNLEDLIKRAKEKRVDSRVVFTGFQEDVMDIMNMMDVFVLPSLHEGIPLAMLEAMSLGKPVVATAVGGIPEVIVHGRNGILIPPRDSSALADAVIRLLGDPGLRDRLSSEARRYVGNRSALTNAVGSLIDIYKSLT